MTTKNKEMERMTKINYLEKTEGMTKVEQLEIDLKNKLMVDAAVEAEREIDPEWYEEYSKTEMQDFKEIEGIKKVKAIFYEVQTDNGNRYYLDSREVWNGIWNFKQVSEEHFNNIA